MASFANLFWHSLLIFHIKQIRGALAEAFRLGDIVWVEHRPATTTDGHTETFELVVRSAFGGSSWKPLDRASVERLVGRKLR